MPRLVPIRGRLLSFSLFLGFATLNILPIHAHEITIGNLEILHPWSRATPPGATTAAGYLVIHNNGTEPDYLIGASAPFAEGAMIHNMTMDGDVMKMRPAEEGLEIPPDGDLVLEPGSSHVMFMGLKKPLVEGDRPEGLLVFKNAGEVMIDWTVEAIGSSGEHDHN